MAISDFELAQLKNSNDDCFYLFLLFFLSGWKPECCYREHAGDKPGSLKCEQPHIEVRTSSRIWKEALILNSLYARATLSCTSLPKS
jgi:hypothetical protein